MYQHIFSNFPHLQIHYTTYIDVCQAYFITFFQFFGQKWSIYSLCINFYAMQRAFFGLYTTERASFDQKGAYFLNTIFNYITSIFSQYTIQLRIVVCTKMGYI